MKTTGHGIEDSKDVENMYHMRLMTLLQELVRERGYRGALRGRWRSTSARWPRAQGREGCRGVCGRPWSGLCGRAWVLRRSASGSPTTPWRNGWGC